MEPQFIVEASADRLSSVSNASSSVLLRTVLTSLVLIRTILMLRTIVIQTLS
jgi:hypothetical protein